MNNVQDMRDKISLKSTSQHEYNSIFNLVMEGDYMTEYFWKVERLTVEADGQ